MGIRCANRQRNGDLRGIAVVVRMFRNLRARTGDGVKRY